VIWDRKKTAEGRKPLKKANLNPPPRHIRHPAATGAAGAAELGVLQLQPHHLGDHARR
jgi:hypothetical protein